jgi:PmbA protein
MEEILARARQVAEEAEVYSTSVMEIPVQFESNRLKHIQTRQSQMVALRLIKNGKFGYATTTQLDNYEDLIENALATAEFGNQAEFHFPSNTLKWILLTRG